MPPPYLPGDYVFARILKSRLPPWPAKVGGPRPGGNIAVTFVRPTDAPDDIPEGDAVVQLRHCRPFDILSDTTPSKLRDTATSLLACAESVPPAISAARAAATAPLTAALTTASSATHTQLNPDALPMPPPFEPVGVVTSPYRSHVDAPRQPDHSTAMDEGVITLRSSIPAASLHCLAGFDFIWVVYWLCYSRNWNAQLVPPRDPTGGPRGVFSTRSPHRPTPIGLSAVRLLGVSGRTLRICGHDILHGTPVLDIKPYLPYTDAIVGARAGWVDDLERRVGLGVAPVPADHKPDVVRTKATAAAALAAEAGAVPGPTQPPPPKRARRDCADQDVGAQGSDCEASGSDASGMDGGGVPDGARGPRSDPVLGRYYGRKSHAPVRLLTTVTLNECGRNETRAQGGVG